MFGQHDDHTKQDDEQKDSSAAVQAIISDDAKPAGASNQAWQHPGTPLENTDSTDGSTADAPAPVDSSPASDAPAASATLAATPSTDDLIDIKREALSKLSPLVGHLDQSPEEKFRTTMMMIQASDDQHLVKDAYEAALTIDDEKTRAQALLDIINEINYFTQHKDS